MCARCRCASRFTGLTSLALPVELLSADLIVSMPKLKTHHWAGMTASMKNFFGVVPGAVYGWPKNILHVHGIEASILDLNATIRPHLAILDGVTGDGRGRADHGPAPARRSDRHVHRPRLARCHGGASDWADPARLPYLAEAGRFLGNLESARIEQRGEPISRYACAFDVVEAFKGARVSQS